MAVNKGYSYAYGWNTYYELILGICWKPNEAFLMKQRAWAWALLMTVCIWIPQTASLSFLWGDFNLIINCLSTNLSIAISIAKIVAIQCQRRVMGEVLITMAQDWVPVRAKEELEIMSETAKISRFISIMSVTLTNMMYVTYIVSQVCSTHLGINVNVDPRLSYGFLFDSYFPFETSSPFVFVPIWLGQFFGTLLSMVSYSGPDSIVSMMVLHLCGQLRIIRCNFKNLVNETTLREPDKYWKTLMTIVKRHEELNRLSCVVKETFSSILLLQMVVCSVTFCFQGYAMFTTLMDRDVDVPLPIYDLVFSFLYAGFTVIHLFVYCYVGDRLLDESTKIPDDFYETPWYELAPKEARAFLFVCHRAKTPLRLNAGKFCTFNLKIFNNILKKSMGYLSMLMAMKERLID